jgi:hypothetical protein
MSVIVVNHLHLSEPIDGIRAEIAREFEPAFRAQPGFRNFWLVRNADDRVTVIIEWDSAEHAASGAGAIGSTVFNRVIAPRLAGDQDRSMGPVVVEVEPS